MKTHAQKLLFKETESNFTFGHIWKVLENTIQSGIQSYYIKTFFKED